MIKLTRRKVAILSAAVFATMRDATVSTVGSLPASLNPLSNGPVEIGIAATVDAGFSGSKTGS
jgi:hypothetical protein